MIGDCTPKIVQFIWCLLTVSLISGCSTVDSTSAASFGSAATATSQQADTTFSAINAITSQSVIAHAAKQSRLNPANFYQVVPTQSVSQWDDAFSAMASYAQALTTLSSPGNNETAPAAISTLATNIQSQANTEMPPGLSTAFVTVATALEKAKFGHDAYGVAITADPTIQDIIKTMADDIGSTNKEGLRKTVEINYHNTMMSSLEISFPAASAQEKLIMAKQYSTALEQQNTADLQLVSLRASIIALGNAHHAIVTKSPVDFTSALATINQQLALAQTALSDLKVTSTAK
jgi:hypothetical protein